MTLPQNVIKLTTPPAMEVVFEISVEHDSKFDIQKLNIDDNKFRNTFPNKSDIKEITINANDISSETLVNHIGYEYSADDNEALTQFRTNGFTYNKLGNYPGGDIFLKDILSAWSSYADQNNAPKVSRLGLRYINVITVKNFNFNYKEFFQVFLEVTEKIGDIEKYQYRYEKKFEEQNCTAVVNFYLDTIKDNAEAKFVLDIDIIKKDISPLPSEENLKSYFKEMRYCKNVIFFSTLKNKVLEQYI